MVSARKALENFINGIDAEKLANLGKTGTIASDDNFRLDMQNITSNNEYNLQVQVNKNPKLTSLKRSGNKSKKAGTTVAGPTLVPVGAPWGAAQIKAALVATNKL
ncbi:hypothetical protein MKEN_01387000 [Mycena kentingensis (nom. inval.)]|nr:hypothetical protein MKEN_01387000 [Mycena kentingensis (nom. inval.)]